MGVMGNQAEATATLAPYDVRNDMITMVSFLGYGNFDARPDPNLMAVLESQGIERGIPVELPYQCRQ